ncbi:MAG: peptidylprolyl isomerase [Clostridia bacterium]|nr:peptidylprolyl isomerase [Clostridia bacterium]
MLLSNSMRRWRIIVAILLVISVLLLSACSSSGVKDGCLLLNGDNVAVDWVLKINGTEIGPGEYRYQFLTMRDENDEGDATFWTEENAAILKEQVVEYILLLVAVDDLADDYGIVRGEDSAAYAQSEYLATQTSIGTEEDFLNALAEIHLDESTYLAQLESDYLQMQLYTVLFGENGKYAITDEEFLEVVDRDYARVRYLSVKFDETNYAEKREHAENLAQMVNDENFVELVNQYSEEKGMIGNPDGLYLRPGMTQDPTFEAACFALERNEISGLIESDNAFYIIKRLPPEAEYVEQNIDDMINGYYGAIFSEMLLKTAENYAVEYAEIYDQISVASMG